MSNCRFTIQIDPSSYIGDSLSIINSNISSLDTNSCDSSNLISYLSSQISLMDSTILNMDNTMNNMILSSNSGTHFHLITTTGTLLTAIPTHSSSNFNYNTGTFTIQSGIYNDTNKIATSATFLLLSGYPVGCSNGSILFTIEGIPLNNNIIAFIKNNTYNYSWHYNTNCINQQYKIFLMGYI